MSGLAGLRDAPATPPYGAASWLAMRASLHPAREAVVDADRRVTYGELDARVGRLARALRARGVERFDRVATLTMNCLEWVELYFATARIGALLVPLNWRLAEPELRFQLEDSGARLLVAGPEHAELAERLGPPVIRIGAAYEALLAAEPSLALPPDEQARFADPHCVLYTSGTTGRPKGAVLTHANAFWNVQNMAVPVGLTGADTTVTALPMFHSGGIGLYTVPTLFLGGRVIVIRAFEPRALLETIERERAALCFGVPAIWLALLDEPDFTAERLPSLRYAVSGGAPHPVALIEAVAARGFTFLQGYGLTETAPGGTLMPVDHWRRKIGSVGRAAPHVELRVVGDDGDDVPAGEIGEVLFRGPNVFAGYWGRPEATAEAFTADGWFRTGDLGTRDDEGFLRLVDRKKDVVITGGENVYSAEVEDALCSHPAVADAAVIGVPDPKWGEAVHAIVVLRGDAGASADELIAHCRDRLAKYKTPRTVAFVDALPRNASGKVLKRDLRRQFGGGH